MQNDYLKPIGSNILQKRVDERPPLTRAEFDRMIENTKQLAAKGGGEHVRTVNGFVCNLCGLLILTVRRDPGPTPDQFLCRKPNCRGHMVSAGYPPTVQHAEKSAAFEFYRPSYSFYIRIGNYKVRSFLDVGGLLLRQRGQLEPIGVEAMELRPMIISAR